MEQVKKLVTKLRKQRGLELELRLGKIKTHTFETGVDLEFFEEVKTELEGCPDLHSGETWTEEMDVFFVQGKRSLRTRVTYPSQTMIVQPVTVEKTRVSHVDFTVKAPFDIRISLEQETPIPVNDLDPVVEPTLVRLKHVKRYYLKRNDVDTWCFVLSRTWTAPTRTQVEEKQHNEIPVYEIECELVDTKVYMDDNTDHHVAESLMMKGCDLLGFPDAEYKWSKNKL